MTPQHGPDPTGKLASQIIETLALSKPQQSTPPSPASNDSAKRDKWIRRWLRMELNHYQLKVAVNQIHDFCANYSKNPARGNTVVIFGENGSGKTHLAKAVSRWQRNIKHMLKPVLDEASNEFTIPACCFVRWADIVDGFKNREGDGFAVIDDLKSCSLLIADDVGSDHDPSGIGVEKLYTILNSREFRWNLITTNYPPESWADRFERRVDSRLYRNAIHIDLSRVPDFSKI